MDMKDTDFVIVSTLHRCGGLQRTEFLTVSSLGGSDGVERTDL